MHILLRGRDIDNIKALAVYEEHDGFAGMKKALAMKPAEVIDVVKASGLRGRGGAGFPTGVKWSFIPQHEPVKFVTVNADESETG
ncbi:MAG: NADH-quinone oxidoreductase subunit F, partial [Chloroflexi bacterium]|nr:NADH-quinone oxidoreductase subunit F [Chloroflexota bacterium]